MSATTLYTRRIGAIVDRLSRRAGLSAIAGLSCLTLTIKPCCRKETARCRKCSFRLKFANNIPYKYKISHASKATLQSSKNAGAKHNLTQNQDSKSFKVTCLESVESSEAISNHNVGFNCPGFDFRRHSI